MKEQNMRFGKFIKTRRLADPRELTLKDVSEHLGMSLTLLSDIENGRRRPFDSVKIEEYCAYLGLPEADKNRMYDLAARETGEVPSDIDDTFMYTDIGDMARHALRLSNAGIVEAEDWREFIRRMEEKKRGMAK